MVKYREIIAILVMIAVLGWPIWPMVPGTSRAAGDWALSFNGDGNYVLIPSINVGTVFSVELWFNLDSSDSYRTLLKDDWSGTNFGTIYLDRSSLEWWFDSQDKLIVLGFDTNAWYHFVFTADGTTVSLYIDGVFKTSGSYSPNYNNDLEVGKSDEGADWDGEIDEVRIYSRVLGPTEVQEHYQKTFSNDADLEGLWHFNEGSETTAYDSSGNGYNGTIYGATWTTGVGVLEQYTLTASKGGAGSGTITSGPSGINCGVDCTEDYDEGTSVTLTATPAGGSTFAGWSGACSGTGTCVLSMTSDKSATATFNLEAAPPGGGGGVINTSPTVKLKTEFSGAYRGELTFNYSASDPDPVGRGGLKSQPIDVYYSDDRGIRWQELAKGQSNTGTYTFDTTKVPDGKDYKIRVAALDGYHSFGDAISGTFTVDNTGPTFDVSVSPLPVKETATITLKITASEELKEVPAVKITQEAAEEKELEPEGSGKEFTASYYVLKDFRGEAVVSITGEDLIGNAGQTITSGGTFSVGRYGPPPSTIIEPLSDQIFTESVISVSGTSEANVKIVLTLNGITEFTTQSLTDGSFRLDNVSLDTANKGYNTLSIIGVNQQGERGDETVVKVKLNGPPKVLITSISLGEVTVGEKEVAWIVSDPNDDELIYSLEYSEDGGTTWDFIAVDFFKSPYKLDTTQLADGSNYLLRLTASDGIEKVSHLSKRFTIKNGLIHVSLSVPLNYVFNTKTPTFTGKTTGSEENIASVKYSLDKGATWGQATPSDGKFDFLKESFEISISAPLRDGSQTIFVKVEDVVNRSVRISRTFYVDTTPPAKPIVNQPLLEGVVDSSMDTNLELDGIQVVFQGKTEPQARVKLVLGNEVREITANERGEFSVENMTLPVHGKNTFSIFSTDSAGNTSQTDAFIFSNNSPQVSVLSPKEGDFLGGEGKISWQAQDPDKDSLTSQILYLREDGAWNMLAQGLATWEEKANTYKWDLTKITGGDYKIKIITSDGMSQAEAVLGVLIDNVVPQITFDVSEPLLTTDVQPTFSGGAIDDVSGIQYVEYSFDDTGWYKALITKGYQTKEASFSFQPRLPLADGEYKVRVRATDRAGNVSDPEFRDLIIDNTPPRIGSNLISSGSLILFPGQDGFVRLFKDTLYKFLVSVSGDAKEVSLSSGEIKFNLVFNKAISLWESEFKLEEFGDYPLEISARDELGNSQTKKIASLRVLPLGQIRGRESGQLIKEAGAALYVFDRAASSWISWDGQAYGQENPQETDQSGEYGFLVPPGKYRLEVSHPRFETARSKELEVKKNRLINTDVFLVEKEEVGVIERFWEYFRRIFK